MRALALLLCLALAACGGRIDPGPVRADLSGGEAGPIAFATTSPYDFPEMIAGTAEPAEIYGRLVMPEGTGPVRGAAILSHGSGGVGGRQERMAERLAEAGIAAFVVDHFGPREIGSTVRDQLRLTAQGMLADAMAAKRLLASHPRIPADRIGIIGWSKGAITAVLGAVDRLAGYAAGGPERFAFAVAYYPFCGFDLGDEALATPLLMLLGGADDWTPAAPCAALAESWAGAGHAAEAVIYPDAPHGFDSGLPFTFTVDRAITVRETSARCTLDAHPEDGRTVTLDGGHRLDSLEGRMAFLEACGVRGVEFGGDRAARRASIARTLAFLDRVLPPG